MQNVVHTQKNRIVRFGFFVLIAILISLCFLTCRAEDEEPYQKKVIITDSNPAYGFSVKKIGKNNYILMALSNEKPNTSNIDPQELVKNLIAIGKPRGKDINLPIYRDFLQYWTDKGSYWVIFMELNTSATVAYTAYISKEKENFDNIDTYLTNEDFMLPLILNYDLGNLLEGLVAGIGGGEG